MQVSATATAPCLDCAERHAHCHSSCERYKAYKELLEENRAKVRAQTDLCYFLRDSKERVRKIQEHKRKADER